MCGVRRVIDVLNLRQYVVNINIILYKDKTVNIFFFMQKILLFHQKCSYSHEFWYIYIYRKKPKTTNFDYKLFYAVRFMFALYIHFFFNFDFILWWCRCYISMLCMQCCDDSNTYLHRHRLWFILSFTKLFGIQSLTKHTNRKLTYKIKKHENISY